MKSRASCPKFRLCAVVGALLITMQLRSATITSVADPTTNFNAVPFPHQNDFFNDQQTGQGGSDIVGDATNPGFYSAFDGTSLYYRVRLGATDTSGQNIAFGGLFWIGIDADGDGALDLFVGVNNQGNNSLLQFQSPGSGANNSPSTTTIGTSLAQYRIAESASNFLYTSVSTVYQPGLTNTDLNTDGNTDSFLTFRIPFAGVSGTATLQGALAGIAGKSVTVSTPLSYVIATSTQQNSLNQDIGGLPQTFDGTQTWQALGGITAPLNLDGTVAGAPPLAPVPEPATWLQLSSGGAALGLSMLLKRWRRGRSRRE